MKSIQLSFGNRLTRTDCIFYRSKKTKYLPLTKPYYELKDMELVTIYSSDKENTIFDVY